MSLSTILKPVLAVTLVGGCTYCGIIKDNLNNERMVNLREFLEILIELQSNIKCQSISLADGLHTISSKGKVGEKIRSIGQDLLLHKSTLADLWITTFETKELQFSKADLEIINTFPTYCILGDKETQLDNLQNYLDKYNRYLNSAETIFATNKHLYKKLGTVGGVILGLFVL